jgi:hypothetical protein
MSNVEMPVSPIRQVNITIRPIRVSDMVDFYVRRKHVDDDSIIERHNAGADLFAPDEMAMRGIHREKVTFHANEIAFVPFHRSDEMTLHVAQKALPMNNVNVFACVNDHNLLNLYSACSRESKFLLIVISNAGLSPSLATAAAGGRVSAWVYLRGLVGCFTGLLKVCINH